LLANLPFFPEARHDSCQRRILLRNVNILDMGPCATYYAYKINRFLFFGSADLDSFSSSTKSAHQQDLLSEITDAPEHMESAGLLGRQRVLALEWEESVKMSWLQHERSNDMTDIGSESGLAARGLSCLFSTLAAIMHEAPLYVKAQLCRHICSVLKVIVHRAGHKSELELMEASEIPEDLKITEELLFRAVTLLEIAGDSRCLVMVLKFLLDRAQIDRHPGYSFIAMALVTHLRTVRALELTLDVWKIGMSSLVKAEQAQKQHVVRKIEDLLKVMIKETQNARPFMDHLRSFGEGRNSYAVSGIAQMVKEMCERAPDAAADAAADEIPVLVAAEQQRPELTLAVNQMLSGGASCEATADLLLKRMSEMGAGEGPLVSCIVRAALNVTVKESRTLTRYLVLFLSPPPVLLCCCSLVCSILLHALALLMSSSCTTHALCLIGINKRL